MTYIALSLILAQLLLREQPFQHPVLKYRWYTLVNTMRAYVNHLRSSHMPDSWKCEAYDMRERTHHCDETNSAGDTQSELYKQSAKRQGLVEEE